MSRILEINTSQEEAVVSRVLLLVHQVIDEKFPNLQNSSRQFTKTVFSDEGENTAQQFLPSDILHDEDAPAIPPPPVDKRSGKQAAHNAQSNNSATANNNPTNTQPSVKTKSAQKSGNENLSNSTRLGTEMESLKPESPLSDWSTRITVALLIAGLIMLFYAVFA